MPQTNWRDWLSKSENQQLVAQLGLGAMGAVGAKGDRDFARQQQVQQRGDSLQDKQRQAYLGRAGDTNSLLQGNLDDDYRNSSAVAELTDPFKYKRELQRDTNRAMQLKKAAQMLGMPTSGLFDSMNSDDAIVRRNASAVMGNEMNAQDISPGRSARNVSSLMGMNPLSTAVSPQNSQLAQYAAMRNKGLSDTRGAMQSNVTGAYDQVDKSLADQLQNGGKNIDPETGKPKTSMWRKVLGGVVKYGVPIALAATGVGAPAAAAMMAGGSVLGDKIAGKSWKDAAIGGALSAIPGGNLGAGAAGGALSSSLTGGIKNEMLKRVAGTAVQQGVRAAGENIPYVGAGLSVANMAMPQGMVGGSPMQAAIGKGRPMPIAPGQQLYNPRLQQQMAQSGSSAFNPNVFRNVRF